jgi:hypothetical protein
MVHISFFAHKGDTPQQMRISLYLFRQGVSPILHKRRRVLAKLVSVYHLICKLCTINIWARLFLLDQR